MTVRRILSIDGGGVRGLVAAIVLEALDAEFRAAGKTCAVSECFDLIAGASSGAIIAAALAMPGTDGDGGFTPSQIRRVFETEARRIFPQRYFTGLPIIGRLPQLFGPLYRPDGLAGVLRKYFGDVVFASANRNIMIPVYSIDPRDIVLFKGGPRYEADDEASAYSLIRLRDAIMGSTAAPTFFPPHRIETPDGARSWTAIDGSVYINDPAMAAVAEAKRLFPGEAVHVVSLGTGRQTRNYPFDEARHWGFSQWISPTGRFRTPLISAIHDGQARTVNRQLMYLLGERYVRFDYRLERGRGSDRIDDASKRNLNRLTRGAMEMVEATRPALRDLARTLSPVYGSASAH